MTSQVALVKRRVVFSTSQEAQNKPEQALTTPQVQELKLNLPQILGKKKIALKCRAEE